MPGDQCRQFKQGLQHVDAQHAVRAEICVSYFIGAGQRARVRCRKVLADIGAAEFVHDDRFVRRISAPRRVCEPVGIAQRFEEQQDGAGMRIVDQHVGQFAHADVGFVADRN